MAKKFNNQGNYVHKKEFNDRVVGKSLTMPNEALRVKQILARAQKGIAPNIVKRAIYIDPDHFDYLDINQAKNYDLAELDQIRKDSRKRIDELNEKLEQLEKQSSNTTDVDPLVSEDDAKTELNK